MWSCFSFLEVPDYKSAMLDFLTMLKSGIKSGQPRLAGFKWGEKGPLVTVSPSGTSGVSSPSYG